MRNIIGEKSPLRFFDYANFAKKKSIEFSSRIFFTSARFANFESRFFPRSLFFLLNLHRPIHSSLIFLQLSNQRKDAISRLFGRYHNVWETVIYSSLFVVAFWFAKMFAVFFYHKTYKKKKIFIVFFLGEKREIFIRKKGY